MCSFGVYWLTGNRRSIVDLKFPRDPSAISEGDWRHCCVEGPSSFSEKARLDP